MTVYLSKDAEKFLSGLPVAKSFLCKNYGDAAAFAKKLGFPVVLKIISRQAVHKTDIGGVRIVNSMEELQKAYLGMEKSAKSRKIRLDGLLVQEFVKGTEIIIGIKKDAAFGHAIMLGIGGTLVELIRDVSFRVCPITEKDAESMINGLKLKNLFYGFRGTKLNAGRLKAILVKVSKIPARYKKIEELDINPLIVNDKEAKIVDCRVVA